MDSLDSVYTSWMRDIELAKSRIIVPEEWIEPTESGGTFNKDREVFTALDIDPNSREEIGLTLNQFEIRAEEHRQSALELLDRIITHAGYNPQSFGLRIEGRAESGTALNVRERKTYITKDKKENYFKSALEDIFYVMLQIDKQKLGTSITPYKPTVEFPPINVDVKEMSEAVNTLNAAQSATIETRVRMLHPDWKEERIQEEVEGIKQEFGLEVPDAMQTGTQDLV